MDIILESPDREIVAQLRDALTLIYKILDKIIALNLNIFRVEFELPIVLIGNISALTSDDRITI
ncbi:hypothetical protein [Microcoleus sp. F4-D5]|uniref:hypothetical protein n=1 Tax=Microcoleus sp. F4-D5 TaxID=2818760 RepID=UPI002FD31D40